MFIVYLIIKILNNVAGHIYFGAFAVDSLGKNL